MKITTEFLVRLAFAVCLFASVSRPVRAQDCAPFTETNFEQAPKDLATKRVEMREIYGIKTVREITSK
jgi:hypothetical protein